VPSRCRLVLVVNFVCVCVRTRIICADFRRLAAEEDDELSEVQPDAVPQEVRDWLASTFTRQMACTRRKGEEKPKFKSVAHAIRAGIFVDRMYRRVINAPMMTFPPDVIEVLKVNSQCSFPIGK